MHHHRLSAWVFGLLALTIISPVLAQSWRGSETIGVQANDSKGKPISGARVVLSYQGRDSQGNPPDVATNQKGRAVITGLAPGSWQVEVKHPGYLSYVAVFDLRGGKKPAVTASFLEAGGGSLTPMRVKLSKGNPREASPPMPTREARVGSPPPAEVETPEVAAEVAPTTEAPEMAEPPTSVEASPGPAVPAEVGPDLEPKAPTIQQTLETTEDTPVAPAPVEESPVEPVSSTVAEVAETVSEPAPATPETSRPGPQPIVEVEAEPEPEVRTEVEPPPAEVETPEVAAEVAPTTEETAAAPLPEPEAEVVIAEREPEPQPEEPSIPQPIEEEPVSEPAQILETPAEPDPEVRPAPTEQPVAPPAVTEEAPTPEPLPEEPTVVSAPVETEESPAVLAETPVAAVASPPIRQAPAVRVPLPDDTPPISSYHDGSCSECRTGEWAIAAFQTAAAGGAPCPAEVIQKARAAAEALGGSTQLELSGFVGPAVDGSGGGALAAAESEISLSYRQQLSPYLEASTNCQVISIVLPKTVRFVGFRYEAFDEGGGGDCTPGQGCQISRAQWLGNPVIQRGANATVVWGVFESTADETPRLGRLKVYFRPPNARWQPPAR